MAQRASDNGSGGDSGASGSRRKGASASGHTMTAQTQEEAIVGVGSSSTAPCGACKFLRRRCIWGCIFAPHFATDQGPAKFAAVHKVFGASNVSKLLSNIPADRRHEAVTTITYEAQARLSDPVYGCVSTILTLQQQVASLKAELALLQNQLMNSRFAYASALQTTQLQQPNVNTGTLQPTYSNNSCASTNLLNLSSFNNNHAFDHLAMDIAAPSSSLEPLHLTRLSQCEEDNEDESKTEHAFNHR